MKFLFTSCLALLLSLAAFAGNGDEALVKMQVSGKVLDQSTLEELTGVEVRVQGTDLVAYTDFEGKFNFNDLPAGTYTLEFRMITYTRQAVITDDADHRLDLRVELAENK